MEQKHKWKKEIKDLKASEWISVKERLPDDNTPVLICFREGRFEVGGLFWAYPSFEDSYTAFQYWDSFNNDGQDWEWNDITHWMPLPNTPKEK